MDIQALVQAKRKKLALGNFTFEDLDPLAQRRVKPNSKVTMLPVNKWTRVGTWWLLNKQISSSLDDAYVSVVVRRHTPFFDWLFLPMAAYTDDGVWVMWWEEIPQTNLVIDVWYIGDGSSGVALVAESL